MRILYVGPDYPGSNGTCWRDAFLELGHDIFTIDSEHYFPAPNSLNGKLRYKLKPRPPHNQITKFNDQVIQAARDFKPQIIFFIQARYILPFTLVETRRRGLNFVYMNDDMFNQRNQTFSFRDTIKIMDCILTTKSYNVTEFHQAGAPYAVYIANAYDPKIHFPARIDPVDDKKYGGDICFIGTFRPERADFLAEIQRSLPDDKFNIWGGGWQKVKRPLYWHKRWKWYGITKAIRGKELWCAEMGKAIQLNKICLGLLNHDNRDLHTSRSFEIPACKGFLLAERTEEHLLYFEEDKEAVYFSSIEELLNKTTYYLKHPAKRNQIALAGYERCLRSDYRYVDRAKYAIAQYHKIVGKSKQ